MRHPSSDKRAAQFMFASPRRAKHVRTSSCAKALARMSYTRGLASFFIVATPAPLWGPAVLPPRHRTLGLSGARLARWFHERSECKPVGVHCPVSVQLRTQPTKDFISIRIGEDAFEGDPGKGVLVAGKAALNLKRIFVKHLRVSYRDAPSDTRNTFRAQCRVIQ